MQLEPDRGSDWSQKVGVLTSALETVGLQLLQISISALLDRDRPTEGR